MEGLLIIYICRFLIILTAFFELAMLEIVAYEKLKNIQMLFRRSK